MGSRRTNGVLLHQISLPARRDYQLRSCSLKAEKSLEFSSSQLIAQAFQNARAISFNASHDEVPFVLHQAPKQRAFHSGPLTSQATAMDHPICAAATTVGAPVGARHARELSASEASFATADSVGRHSDDLSEVSQEQHRSAAKDSTVGRAVEDRSVAAVRDDNSRSRSTPHFPSKPTTRAEVAVVTEPTYIVTPRRAVSGDQKTSRSSAENRARSSELTRASRTMSSVDNNNRSRSTEILRASRSNLDSRGRNTELMLISLAGKPNPLKLHPPTVAKVSEGSKLGENNRAGAESRRRPTASIAWDSLNKSQGNSPQHELAAIPFKWEEVPGKPITIADAAERAMARRFLKDHGSESRTGGRDLQARTTTSAARKSPTETAPSPAKEETTTALGLLSSPNSSFRSSHRFYARTTPGERSFGPRKSIDGTHVISEVETEAHIDLVAPAAAKFLVESWVSPNVTPEPNLTTSIPFVWEAAPGIPKVDEDAIESNKPVQLQLPPRLVAPPPVSADFMSKEEMRGRQRTRSMSGPLAGYYPHTSPSRRRQQQQSPPVMRSCSPSKRSISPSKIQALAKHFSRKVSSPLTHAENSRESRNYRHSYTLGHNSGPLDDFHDRAGGSNRVLGRSASGAMAVTSDLVTQDDHYTAEHAQMRAARSFASGPLDYGAKPVKRYSSPSKRSISPSRIHALAKQLTSKMRPSSEVTTLEDPNWPVSIKQVLRQHSFTLGQTSSVSLDRSNVNARAAATEGFCQEKLGRDPWSPTSILQGPNDHSDGSHPSGPSSASDMDSQTQASTQATTPVSVALSKSLSKSLSRVSYESFEHCFTEPASPGQPEFPPTNEDAGAANSPLGSPYLGPTSDDYRVKESSGGAAEGVKALIKMCRSGSTWRKGRTHTPEMWAPTLASYFQCLEATMSNPGNARAAAITHTEQQDSDGQGASSLNETSQTRLPYRMPSHLEQSKVPYNNCDSPNAEFTTCLGVKLSPARFVSRGENFSSMDSVMAWSERHLSHSIPTNNLEDGFRSPAYAATLELLSPSAELIRKKKRIMGSSRGVKLVIPSSSMRRRTQFVVCLIPIAASPVTCLSNVENSTSMGCAF